MRAIRTLATGAALLLAVASSAQSGPFRDFEAQLRADYAIYREALFATNKGDASASKARVDAFAAAWSGLTATWKSAPPPQYADDGKFAATLEDVRTAIDAARAEVANGRLREAHLGLEKIRDILGDLRKRNGVRSFSDEMNEYHEAMEKALGAYKTLDAAALPQLREDAAVLSYLSHRLKGAPEAGGQDVGALVDGVAASTEALRKAAAAGNVEEARQALGNL
ncbi:MAG: hypothetical protein KGM42_09880, partial [Hyphomicrobiales bacterium]|nr:hypothetical protein [Hyphomicrobiales bacterium]